MKEYLETGKIVGTHGVRGAVRVQPLCDDAAFLCRLRALYFKEGESFRPIDIISARPHGGVAVVALSGVTSANQAELLLGKTLFLRRSEVSLEEGRYFVDDIIGCEVFDFNTGERLGEICDVTSTAAGDLWHVRREGKIYPVPKNPQFVKSVDIGEKRVEIQVIRGLLDDAD